MWIDSFKTLRFYTKRYAKNQHFDKIRRNQRSAIRGCNTEKKVLVCMHSLDWGGAERFAYETLLFLKKHKIPYLVFIEKKTEIAGHFLSILDAAKAIVYGQRYQKSESQLLELINSTAIEIANANLARIPDEYTLTGSYRYLPSSANESTSSIAFS